jgi:hypothetical protein
VIYAVTCSAAAEKTLVREMVADPLRKRQNAESKPVDSTEGTMKTGSLTVEGEKEAATVWWRGTSSPA